ncbi:UNVERIFIED_CONTAM: hypothetical protein RMT77_017228 [Armadillidium vulgare]
MKELLFLILLVAACYLTSAEEQNNDKLLYITIASNETNGYKRFMRSASIYSFSPKVLGMGSAWLGGDMKYAGGGYKVNLFRKEIEKHKDKKDLVILFTDSYDVIVTGEAKDILKQFRSFNANIVFSSEDSCWPDESLKKDYPLVLHGYRYLNSGGIIGYAPYLYKLLSTNEIENTEDDQLYYTKIFLDADLRKSLKIKLDTQAKLFQNLNGVIEDVALDFQEDDTRLINTAYHTNPIIIHGNGPSKKHLNHLGNYLAKSWVKGLGCLSCSENQLKLEDLKEYPKVLVAVFISIPTPFLEETLDKIANLDYPKNRIYLFITNNVAIHEDLVQKFVAERKKEDYIGVKVISSSDNIKEWPARDLAIEKCISISCDAYLNVDSEVHLDNPAVLKLLLSYNKPILAPIIAQIGKLWSTFWGAVTEDGFYARSSDYMDIVNGERRGIWNVPYIYGVYLIQKSVLENPETRPNYVYNLKDHDIAMAMNFRKKEVFMYAVNLDNYYGHLVKTDVVSTTNLHNDLWQVHANQADWEVRYLHPQYYEALNATTNEMPCNDVFWFPLFSTRFSKELIETMENFGDWSGGKNDDPRLNGGYENVPTDDIHMNQIGFEQEWLYILKEYVKPMAEKLYFGYNSDARAIMNFVVRYTPTAQNFLRPHHDSSTYTINVGLNRPGIDYEGGGANFIRQNCPVVNTKVGWALIHPGRLTHYHEGLPTTKGTRYILVSFIDP